MSQTSTAAWVVLDSRIEIVSGGNDSRGVASNKGPTQRAVSHSAVAHLVSLNPSGLFKLAAGATFVFRIWAIPNLSTWTNWNGAIYTGLRGKVVGFW